MSPPAPTPPPPLHGLVVVELATGIAGPFAGKLFADFGADVIKVEPPAGDPSRRVRLDPDEEDDPETGPLFLHLNTNKRSIVADLAARTEDRRRVLELAAGADVLIESFRPGTMAGWGLGPADLQRVNPRLVVTSMTPFGQDGPYAADAASEVVLYALGGPMAATGSAGREPMKLAGSVVQYQGGNVAAMASLAAVRRAAATGRGAVIDVANLETQLGSIDRRVSYLLHHQFAGVDVGRQPMSMAYELPIGIYPTADGYVQIHTLANWVPGMMAALGDTELAERHRRKAADPDWPGDPTLVEDTEAALYGWLLSRPRQEVMTLAQAHRWPITALNAPVDLLEDPHLAERGFFVDVEHPRAGRYRTPGAPWRVQGGWRLRRPAPLLGQHDAELRADPPPPRPCPTAAGEDRLPLDGVRVLDLTVVWAGPYCTMLLGDLGADVVRVDNPAVFPTATRGVSPRPAKELVALAGPLGSYPDLDPGERPWNRHSMYCAHARNKRGVTADLRSELGRELFLRLAEQCDVFVENNSARVLDHLGIGWETLHRRNPRLIVVRMAPMGLSGPYRDFIGFGVHFEALCGFTAVRGYTDADPTAAWPTFHMDPATGVAGAFAVLAALRRREQTGVGELVEFAQAENMMQHLGEYYVDAARTGRVHHTIGNRDHRLAPQGCYAAAGENAYVVLTVGDDACWSGLAALVGRPDLASLSVAERRARHDELDAVLAGWCATRSASEAAAAARAVGVAAAPVHGEGACLADPHLTARGAFRENGSADLGRYRFPGHLFRWDGPALRWEPLCRMGADNDEVYRELLGATEEELAGWREAGQLSEVYRRPDGTSW